MKLRRSFGLLLLMVLALALESCAPRLPGWLPWQRRPVYYQRVHIVRKGETVSGIARRYGVSAGALARLNGLRDPDRIEVGQRLRIPRRDAVASLYHKAPARTYRPRSSSPPAARLSKPIIWPVRGSLTRSFSKDAHDPHKGIDIAAPVGTHVRAAESGKVLFSGVGPEGYGLMVIIQHDSNLVTVYAHNRANLVREGQRVVKGQHIAYVGDSGNAKGPHLHFEVRSEAEPFDPIAVLPSDKRR